MRSCVIHFLPATTTAMTSPSASIFAVPGSSPPLAPGDFGFIHRDAAEKMLSFLRTISSLPIMTLDEAVREAQSELPEVQTTRVLVVPGRDRNNLPFGGTHYDFLQVGGITYKCQRCASGGMCMVITDLHIFPECPLLHSCQDKQFLPVRELLAKAVTKLFETAGALHCVMLCLDGCPPCSASRDHLCRV